MNACTRRSVFIGSKYFLTSPIFRIARDAELQVLVVGRPLSVLTQTHIFQWWNDVGNREPYELILKVTVIIYLSKLLKHHLLQRDITFSSKIFNSQIFEQNFKHSPVKLKTRGVVTLQTCYRLRLASHSWKDCVLRHS